MKRPDRGRVVVCLLLATVVGGCAVRQARPRQAIPTVLLAAFLDTRPLLGHDARVVLGPYRLSPDTIRHLWAERDLRPILADTSVRLGDPTVRAWTLEGRPFPWAPGPGEVGVSFSMPDFGNDTTRVLVSVIAGLGEGSSHALYRRTLVRRGGRWTVVRREELLTS
jgi:hypothetical protein